MNNKLIDNASLIFNFLLRFKKLEIKDYFVVKNEAKESIKQFKSKCKVDSLNQDDISKAEYAYIALIDEILLKSKWEGYLEWMTNPLQIEYFKENHAGIKFFIYLDQLLKQKDKNINLIEVYYMCIKLGFVGRYRNEIDKKVEEMNSALMQDKHNFSKKDMFNNQKSKSKVQYIKKIYVVYFFIFSIIYILYGLKIKEISNAYISLLS